jgi:hypothetical protein
MEDESGNNFLTSFGVKIYLTESVEKTFERLHMVAAPVDGLNSAVKTEDKKENSADQTHSEGVTTEEKQAIEETVKEITVDEPAKSIFD